MAPNAPPANLPVIEQYKDNLPAVVAQAEEVLGSAAATPRLFQRGHLLVAVQGAEPQPAALITRTPGTPVIRVCPKSTLRLCLANGATWCIYDKRSKALEATMPQPWVIDTVLELGKWPHVPPLRGIVTAPTLRQDGTVLDTPGYDEGTGLFYDPGTTRFPPIPDAPTRADAEAALVVLQEPFKDFPFREPHHVSATLAALFTVLFRHAIDGNVPFMGVNAPTAGTGKTLLVDVIAITATGRSAPKMSQPAREEEWNKQLLTCALEGDQIILIDNCTETLASGELCRAITADIIKGRILGVMENGEAPQKAVYFATGNGLRFKSDITRRVLPIELESSLERPETRTDFTLKKPLPVWTMEHRPALVHAALTIARAYHLATDKPLIPTWGSFEAWRALVCGPLLWLGLADPVRGVEELREDDEEREQLRTFLLAWHAVYANTPTTLSKVKQDIAAYTTSPMAEAVYVTLNDALQPFDTSGKPTLNLDSVGKNLKKRARRIICGKTITRGKTRTSAGYPWTVETRNLCRCVGCVDAGVLAREKGNKVTVKSIDPAASTPPTLSPDGNPVSGNNVNVLHGVSGGQTTYTTPPDQGAVPAFTAFTVTQLWCAACSTNVSFRALPQLDGTELYLCDTCDTEVGRKAPPVPGSTGALPSADPATMDGDTLPLPEVNINDIPF